MDQLLRFKQIPLSRKLEFILFLAARREALLAYAVLGKTKVISLFLLTTKFDIKTLQKRGRIIFDAVLLIKMIRTGQIWNWRVGSFLNKKKKYEKIKIIPTAAFPNSMG